MKANWVSPTDRDVLRLLYERMWGQVDTRIRLRMVGTLFLVLIQSVAVVVTPLFFKQVIDSLTPTDLSPLVVVPVGVFVAFAVVSLIARVASELHWAVWEPGYIRLQREAELSWFTHVQNLSLRFHLTKRTGSLDQSINKATRGLEMILTAAVYTILPMLLELVLIATILGNVLDWRFLAILAVTIVLYLTLLLVSANRIHAHMKLANELHVEARGLSTDAILNYETVALFGSTARVTDRVRHRYAGAIHHWDRFFYARAVVGGAQAVVILSGLVAMLWIGMQDVATGAITVGSLVLINSYLLQIVRPLEMFNRAYRAVRQGLTYLAPMQRILAERPEVADAPDAIPLPPGGGRVEFRDVSFAYDPRRPILKDVSFTVEPGRTLAIVGATGSGKSTISRLLLRFYDATEGSIHIDGVDVRRLKLVSLRTAIGVVPQDTVLFNDTLKANLAFANPEAGEADIADAVRRAQLAPFVASLPDGLESRVGERGLKLSGGEKQRVAIARALLKRPRLLLFDEATSALDTSTERAVLDAIRAASAGTTTIMIAHRLSSIAHADTILVLDHGRIRERGTHPELLDRGGLYAEMWRRQAEAAPEAEAAE